MKWKTIDIKGIKENTYQISKNGTVRRIDNGVEKAVGINGEGYPYIKFCDDGETVYIGLHRLLAIHFIPKTDDDIIKGRNFVHFKDFDHSNISLDNLEWTNSFELLIKTKLHYDRPDKPVGYARYICKLLERGYDNKSICDILSIPRSKFGLIIANIRKRKIYKNISKKYNF